MEEGRKVALVISGGGAKGAFAVGVLQYLHDRHRDSGWFAIVGGTSTGALIAPMAALMGGPEPMATEALRVLEDMYGNSDTDRILHRRHVIEWLWRRDCVYTSGPLRELIETALRPEWFEWLHGDEAPECYVVYVDYWTGKKSVVKAREPGTTRELFMQAMLASASVPVIVEAARVGKTPCYDGGMRDLLPLGTAINMQAEVLLPIYLDPEVFPEIEAEPRRVDRIMMRTIDIMTDEALRNDVRFATQINTALRARRELESEFPEGTAAGDKIRAILGRPDCADLFGRRLVDIIDGVRPDGKLTDNSLVFKPEEMSDWMRQGREKAEAVLRDSPFGAAGMG